MRFLVLMAILLSRSAIATSDAELPAMHFERTQSGLIIRGTVSSAGHEQILQQTAAREFEALTLEMQVTIGRDLPAQWSLIIDLALRALKYLQAGSAEFSGSEVILRGLTTDPEGWYQALGRLEQHLPATMAITSTVSPISNGQSLDYLCRRAFGALIRGRNVAFGRGSTQIGTSAHGLLDGIVELSVDCPDARIHVTAYGDGGPNNESVGKARADAVVAYLLSRGFEASRLSTRGSETARNRRVDFSISFR